MQDVLTAASIPPLVATILRPWVNRAETATRGMGEIVKADSTSASKSLRRRIIMTPALEIAIGAAENASATLAQSLGQAGPDDTPSRAPAIAALTELIDSLRGALPSANTVALGLAW